MSLALSLFVLALHRPLPSSPNYEVRIEALLRRMTLEEKLGQMSQTGMPPKIDEKLRKTVRKGLLGSVYGGGTAKTRAELQRIATKESRLHIPLIIGSDVIHGYATGLPIPLAQAASFDPELVQECSGISAQEASSVGLHWTFSPMMDIARDPRWGRIAEGYGEDPYLASAMGVATVRGYQGANLALPTSLAACGKHYVGYGASEAGRDYNTTWIPENLLRDVYLKPFQATAKAGIASFMSAFNAINGVPASGNPLTLRQILRKEWKFDGMVVSDYESVKELIAHGFAADGADAAKKAIEAGVDMEMVSHEYLSYGGQLVARKNLDPKLIDDSVRNILRTKFRLGLFDGRLQPTQAEEPKPTQHSRHLAQKLAEEGQVLLKNEGRLLPLSKEVGKIAVIGPLADRGADQLGAWAAAPDGFSITPLMELRRRFGERVLYSPGVSVPEWDEKHPVDTQKEFLLGKNKAGFADAVEAARKADVVLLFVGETSDVAGEASSRTNLDLPGAQSELVEALAQAGKPIVGIVMAGRPLTIADSIRKMKAVLYAWHGGTMAGPAIVGALFGETAPSGKLPVTFPRAVGQIPIYYNSLSTGRPSDEENHFTSRYLDLPFTPEYPFGYGLSYTTFRYSATRVRPVGHGFRFTAVVQNTGSVAADEVVQFYVHQKFASVARPVRELKGFRRIHLLPGERREVSFELASADLAFWNAQMRLVVEPGACEAWIAPDSTSGIPTSFAIK